MKRKRPKDKIDIGYYAVAFLDLLGQQEQLRSLRSLPDTNDQKQMNSFIESLKGTFGVVSGVRKTFLEFFSSFSKRIADVSMLTAEQRKLFETLTSNPIQIMPFSDATVVFLSLRRDRARLPARGVYGILGAAASIALLSLAAGYSIRGGIDIGLGMEIEKGEIYGPCLSRAYTLESKIAQYPRVVAGKELIEYLQVTSQQEPKDIYAQAGISVANACLSLLAVDDDGCPIVDYLGEFFRKNIAKSIGKEVVDKAHEHVIKSSQRFRDENNTKMAFRYTLMRSYFDQRLPNWTE